jgi:hypothetical protein
MLASLWQTFCSVNACKHDARVPEQEEERQGKLQSEKRDFSGVRTSFLSGISCNEVNVRSAPETNTTSQEVLG